MTHRGQTSQTIEYNSVLVTASFGATPSAIIWDIGKKLNIAFRELSDIQDIVFSITYPITGKEMEWKELVLNPLTSVSWTYSTSNKLGQMAQDVGKK